MAAAWTFFARFTAPAALSLKPSAPISSANRWVIGAPPTVSTPERLDAIGEAARRLEHALDPTAPSPFTVAMRSAVAVADALARDVESAYLVPLQ